MRNNPKQLLVIGLAVAFIVQGGWMLGSTPVWASTRDSSEPCVNVSSGRGVGIGACFLHDDIGFCIKNWTTDTTFRPRGVDMGQLLATTAETALSERRCKTAQVLAADFVVTGVITDWKEIATPAINIPGLDWIWRGIACWMTVDVRVLDLNTAEFKAYQVTTNVSGIEIIGIRFGCSPQDLARAVSKQIAQRLGSQCRGR